MALVAWAIAGVVLLVLRQQESPVLDALDRDAGDAMDVAANEEEATATSPRGTESEQAPAAAPGLAPGPQPSRAAGDALAFWQRYLGLPEEAWGEEVGAAGARLARDVGELAVAARVAVGYVDRVDERGRRGVQYRLGARMTHAMRAAVGQEGVADQLTAWLLDNHVAVAQGVAHPQESFAWCAALRGAVPLAGRALGGVVDGSLRMDSPQAAGEATGPQAHRVWAWTSHAAVAATAPLIVRATEPTAAIELVEARVDSALATTLDAGHLPTCLAGLAEWVSNGQRSVDSGQDPGWCALVKRWIERWPLAWLETDSISHFVDAMGVDPAIFLAQTARVTSLDARRGLTKVLSAQRDERLRALVGAVLESGNPDTALLLARRLLNDKHLDRSAKRALVLLSLRGGQGAQEAVNLLPHVIDRFEQARPALDALLSSDVPGVPARAADAVMALATVPSIDRHDVLRQAERLSGSTHEAVRLAVVRHLGQVVKLPADRAAVESLLGRALNDRDPVITRAAADSLGWMAQRDEGLRPIFARHRPHPDPETDELLAAWIEEFGEHDAEVADEGR
ncbi:MAG: hypothetical protein R3F05_05460 [Planctomycetota bacterium]